MREVGACDRASRSAQRAWARAGLRPAAHPHGDLPVSVLLCPISVSLLLL